MTEPLSRAIKPPVFRSTDTAPFVYFDAAPAYGVIGGAIEVELTARALIPDFSGGSGPLTQEILATAHLRCSPTAAALLLDLLSRALELVKQLRAQAAEPTAGAAGSRLN